MISSHNSALVLEEGSSHFGFFQRMTSLVAPPCFSRGRTRVHHYYKLTRTGMAPLERPLLQQVTSILNKSVESETALLTVFSSESKTFLRCHQQSTNRHDCWIHSSFLKSFQEGLTASFFFSDQGMVTVFILCR